MTKTINFVDSEKSLNKQQQQIQFSKVATLCDLKDPFFNKRLQDTQRKENRFRSF